MVSFKTTPALACKAGLRSFPRNEVASTDVFCGACALAGQCGSAEQCTRNLVQRFCKDETWRGGGTVGAKPKGEYGLRVSGRRHSAAMVTWGRTRRDPFSIRSADRRTRAAEYWIDTTGRLSRQEPTYMDHQRDRLLHHNQAEL